LSIVINEKKRQLKNNVLLLCSMNMSKRWKKRENVFSNSHFSHSEQFWGYCLGLTQKQKKISTLEKDNKRNAKLACWKDHWVLEFKQRKKTNQQQNKWTDNRKGKRKLTFDPSFSTQNDYNLSKTHERFDNENENNNNNNANNNIVT